MAVSREVIVAEMEGTYSYLSQEDAGGTECDLSRRYTTGILCEIQNLDESIQCRQSAIAPFQMLGLWSHRRGWW